MKISTVSVIGAGAVGGYYGSILSASLGREKVKFIVDRQRKIRYEKDGIHINGKRQDLSFISPQETVPPVDLIIIATKNTSLNEAVKAIKNHVGPETTILSLLNGIDSEEELACAYGSEKLLYGFVTALSSRHDGKDITVTAPGRIVFGEKDNMRTPRLTAVEQILSSSGIETVIPDDILHELWLKFALNTMYNSLSALTHASLGDMRNVPEVVKCLNEIFAEVTMAGATRGVILSEKDRDVIKNIIDQMPPDSWTSMRQDIEYGRPTENRWFCGTVARISRENGFPAPMCQYIFTLLDAVDKVRQIQVRSKQKLNLPAS
ncbi:ketopantoate reductase family protein [Parasphaerochaeta coccoides]|uniref:2-dehydropantoate 2-reductase n=1 Tax=Parasphaerochaeta coccoides (strain ATCC BAA-1237 / DSM 17374 / SPN1) TaxID=760011 RepID=F4GM47_PARC1|nr:ketopantoate reductase family protein [Parasphaerochaeta coccoides]AEC02522.1 2-dehydropantoate 2-reductase [Parasphaerochaeta coccoides DSM 17374]